MIKVVAAAMAPEQAGFPADIQPWASELRAPLSTSAVAFYGVRANWRQQKLWSPLKESPKPGPKERTGGCAAFRLSKDFKKERKTIIILARGY